MANRSWLQWHLGKPLANLYSWDTLANPSNQRFECLLNERIEFVVPYHGIYWDWVLWDGMHCWYNWGKSYRNIRSFEISDQSLLAVPCSKSKKAETTLSWRMRWNEQIISEEGMILESHGQTICLSKLDSWGRELRKTGIYLSYLSCSRSSATRKAKITRSSLIKESIRPEQRRRSWGLRNRESPSTYRLPKLKTIEVVNCENLECLSIARDLPQLEKLSLYDLPQLKQVFGREKGGDDGDGNNSVLSMLRNLRLWNLQELFSFSIIG